jgi:ubiquitin carboxyl-terminal hydrolase 16/45
LGGHYVSYVALPNEPSSHTNGSTSSSSSSLPRSADFGSTDTREKPPQEELAAAGSKAGKRQWAYISDTSVRLTSLEEVLRARAYLCMYQRV